MIPSPAEKQNNRQGPNFRELKEFSSVLSIAINELHRLEMDIYTLEHAISRIISDPLSDPHFDVYLADPIRQRVSGVSYFLSSLVNQIDKNLPLSMDLSLENINMGEQYERFSAEWQAIKHMVQL